jgi:hypothetical protein
MATQKYFYTILFLDDYYPERRCDQTTVEDNYKHIETPILKNFDITKDTNNESIFWNDENTLVVRHNLPLPLTLEMWNAAGKPIFYCPLLKENIDSLSVGQVVLESKRTITLHFNEDNPPPTRGETFKLAMKTLPSFDTTSLREIETIKKAGKALDEIIATQPVGMAIVFRRHNIDALMDLIVDFDESYWHSLSEGTTLRYLTQKSLYNSCRFTTKYTDNLQDVLDLIDTSEYEIKFSWQS